MKKTLIFVLSLPLIMSVGIAIIILSRDEVTPKKSVAYSSEDPFTEADHYFQQGKYQDAIRVYQDARHHYLNSTKAPKALFQIGASYERLELYLEAAAIYQTFLGFYPHDPLIPQVRLAKATIDLELGKLEGIKEELIDIIDKHTDPVVSSQAKYLLAEYYYQRKDYENAQKYYEMTFSPTLSYVSEHQAGFLHMGEVYLANKKFTEAKRILLKLINIYPKGKYSDKALTILGDSFLAEGKLEKAVLIYGYAANSYPLREWGQRSRLRLADLSLEKDRDLVTDLAFYHPDYSYPLQAYQKLAAGSPYSETQGISLVKLVSFLYQQGNYLEAYSVFKNIERNYIDSRYYKQAQLSAKEAIKKLVDSLYYQNDFLTVVDFYRKNRIGIERDSDPRLLFQIASSCQNLGLYALAADIYKLAAKYAPKANRLSQEILINLGETYSQDEKYGLAAETIKDFLLKYSQKNTSCRAYPVLINALYHQEEFTEAINIYLGSLKLCPHNKDNPYINYLIGTSYQNIGNISQAKIYFRQALQLTPIPLSGSLSLQLGNALYRTKDYKAAAEAYSKALKAPGTGDMTPGIIYQLGRSYQKQGLKKEAQKAYKELLSKTNDPFWEDLARVWLD